MMIQPTSLISRLESIDQQIYRPNGLVLSKLKIHAESGAYGACSFALNTCVIEHRVAKITPTKVGQFVTLWKRDDRGNTTPLEASDLIHFVCITTISNTQIGQFFFPISVLIDRGIIRNAKTSGKRGFRVYPRWDTPTSKQANETQRWQDDFFLDYTSPAADFRQKLHALSH